MNKWGLRLAAGIGIQLVILLGFLAFKEYTVLTGDTVVLEVGPVDPTDPFRGDYVNLRFDVSRLSTSALGGDDDFDWDDTVYVELVQDGRYWRAVAVYHERHRERDDSVLLKGKVQYPHSGDLSVDYGLEDFFVRENTGRLPTGDFGLEVRVDRWGNGIGRRLLLDGQPYDFQRDR
jgi:uncharacterized membrane-anchored protein